MLLIPKTQMVNLSHWKLQNVQWLEHSRAAKNMDSSGRLHKTHEYPGFLDIYDMVHPPLLRGKRRCQVDRICFCNRLSIKRAILCLNPLQKVSPILKYAK